MSRRRRSPLTTVLLLLPGLGFILIFLLAALLMTVLQSLGFYSLSADTSIGFQEWLRLFDQQFADSFLYSTQIGLLSAFGTLLFAYPLALYLRRGFVGKRWFSSLLRIPLFVPALVAAFLILNILSFHGIVNEILTTLGLVDEPLRMLHDPWGLGVVGIQIWKNVPFQVLIIASVIESIPTDLEDAARNLGASELAVVRYILFPLSIPGILIAVVLVFIGAFGDYSINVIAGPHYPQSLAVSMYIAAKTLGEWGRAACIALVIIVASLVFVWIYARLAGLITGKA